MCWTQPFDVAERPPDQVHFSEKATNFSFRVVASGGQENVPVRFVLRLTEDSVVASCYFVPMQYRISCRSAPFFATRR